MAQSDVSPYFMDVIATIFSKRDHPLVLFRLHALRFMGVPVVTEDVSSTLDNMQHTLGLTLCLDY